jgi:hypothetical protein
LLLQVRVEGATIVGAAAPGRTPVCGTLKVRGPSALGFDVQGERTVGE